MIRYRLVKMRQPIAGYTYGILGEENSENDWHTVAIVPDVSSNQAFVSQLADKCTKGQLSPIHLLDVIIDALP